jgi:hypothetical protein
VNVELKRSQSSVEVKRDAKGAVSYTIKAYGDSIEEALRAAVDAFHRAGKGLAKLEEVAEKDAV